MIFYPLERTHSYSRFLSSSIPGNGQDHVNLVESIHHGGGGGGGGGGINRNVVSSNVSIDPGLNQHGETNIIAASSRSSINDTNFLHRVSPQRSRSSRINSTTHNNNNINIRNSRLLMRREDSVLHMFQNNINTTTNNNNDTTKTSSSSNDNVIQLKKVKGKLAKPPLIDISKQCRIIEKDSNVVSTKNTCKDLMDTNTVPTNGTFGRNVLENQISKDITFKNTNQMLLPTTVHDESYNLSTRVNSRDHFKSIKHRRRLSLVGSSNHINNNNRTSQSCRNVYHPPQTTNVSSNTASYPPRAQDDERIGTTSSLNVQNQMNQRGKIVNQDKIPSSRSVRFLLPKNHSSSNHKIKNKPMKRNENVQQHNPCISSTSTTMEEEKRLDNAIKKAYFYSKYERKQMRMNAILVMEIYMDENPRKIDDMKQFFIDCRNSNITTSSNTTETVPNRQDSISKCGLTRKEFNFVRDWSSSDVRGLEDLMCDDLFIQERKIAIQSVLGYQEYYIQQQNMDSHNSSWDDFGIHGYGEVDYEDHDDDDEYYNNVTQKTKHRQYQQQIRNDNFHEAMRTRCLSVSRRSREFAVKIAIGDALEAKKHYST
jgi:hypothetical protein